MIASASDPLAPATSISSASPIALTAPGSDPRLRPSSVAFVLVAIIAAFMLFLGVFGFVAPLSAAHAFGIDLVAPADAFYIHVKADRDLGIGVLLTALLVYRRATPLALVIGPLCILAFADCALSLLDPRGRAGYALAVHGSAVIYGIVTTALLVRARRGGPPRARRGTSS